MRRIKLHLATDADAEAIAALQASVAEKLTQQFGRGHWSTQTTAKGVRIRMTRGKVFVAKSRGKLIAALCLTTRKPWAIDVSYFTQVKQPLYLVDMAVAVAKQGRGLGRQCVEEAVRLAGEWPADAIRLDAYDAPAGAGDFYARCGFRER